MKNILILVTIILLASNALAAQLTVDEVVSKANNRSYYQGKDGSAKANMVVTDSQGRTRQRQLTILKLNIQEGGDQKYFVYFHKPNDVKGMSYIVWKHVGKDDDRWLYLPAMDLVRRIAASDKRSSFAGTTFLYEDISGRSIDLDIHELSSGDAAFYVVKNTPKDIGVVEFSYYIVKIDKINFVPMKAEYFDKSGKLYRTVEALEVKDIQGYPTVTKMKASDLNANSNTVTEFTDIKYDIGLKDDIFTERFLRTPPQQWLKE
ncbi:MAG TPA: outer membrane lipoprotein-sorting protein [Candidatus Omnitrophota bacterium]|nr:outer membrane lipoprotein-sorting protein [Candidatus Omnitrophota bacterium]